MCAENKKTVENTQSEKIASVEVVEINTICHIQKQIKINLDLKNLVFHWKP